MKILVIGMCGNSFFYNKNDLKILKEEPGGKGYNQAVGIKKLGIDVSFIGAVGNDISGDCCVNFLKQIGVKNYIIKKSGKTTYANIIVDEFGNNEIKIYSGICLNLNDFEYIRRIIDEHDLIMLQNEIEQELNIKILEYSISKNKQIIVNPAPKCKWVKPYLNDVLFVTPNEEEARYLFNINDDVDTFELGKFLLDNNYNNILVTLGSNGALLVKDNKIKYFDSIEVNAIDTTGAGDLMNACIAYGISKNMNIFDSILLGIKVCAYSVQRKFVIDSYPTDIKKFL